MQKLRIIVGGFIGIFPAGGVTWDYIQYPLGLAALGHDVYYFEDTRLYPLYQKPADQWNNSTACIEHLKEVMEHFGFKYHWAYRDEVSGNCFGMSEQKIKEICKTADVFINLSCSTFLREEYFSIPVRILIDTDPMFTQIQYASSQKITSVSSGITELISNHNFHFTFGENIGAADCLIPLCNIKWHTTRQPVCLNFWNYLSAPDSARVLFTTLMNWTAAKKLCYENEEWGQKDVEFNKVLELPGFLPDVAFSIGINQTGLTGSVFPANAIQSFGWNIFDPEKIAGGWQEYSNLIQKSSGEFSVAKQTYVKANTGWFSCRSACYLASGRPVVTQETGWSAFIPEGKGVFAFKNIETAVDSIQQITKDWKQQSLFAREIAEEYFDSGKILNSLLEKVA